MLKSTCVTLNAVKYTLKTNGSKLVNGAIAWKWRRTAVCYRDRWCATALAPLARGLVAGGIIYYMEKTIGFHVQGMASRQCVPLHDKPLCSTQHSRMYHRKIGVPLNI